MKKIINSDRSGKKTFALVYMAMFAVIIALCSWISVPLAVPFTLQTFGVFCAVGMLGGKLGTVSVIVYILLGAVGLPVFAGFKGGAAVLLGPTGGYILGFVASALIYWLITSLFGKKLFTVIIGMVSGLLVCYAFGTAWFMIVYAQSTEPISLATALGWCVIPFILPDIVKIALAVTVSTAVPRAVKVFAK